MKYKVWGKAKAVLKPPQHHFETMVVIIFLALLIAAIVIAIRLGMLYSGTVYRGDTEPYLQMLGSDRVTIRWRSHNLVSGGVELVNQSSGSKVFKQEENPQQRHEIVLTGLQPATRYLYRIYHNENIFRQGEDFWFKTAPAPGSEQPVRIWLLGDPGRAGKTVEKVKSSSLQWLVDHSRNNQPPIDMIMTTGDNAYEDGAREEYQLNLFDVHKKQLRNYAFWPVRGNHDAKGWSFFKLFSFPTSAELGGVASGTERYYSFDYSNIHFVFLDSYGGAYQEGDAMLQWLTKDLKQTKQLWIVALMHHPAYTRASHNSNDAHDSGSRMFNVRKRILPVLEQAGVDLVIAGHSHSYERSRLLDCHYGLTNDFKKSSVLQEGNNFVKPLVRKSHSGSIHVVFGSSAQVIEGRFDHPALPITFARPGSMFIDVNNKKLTSYFIDYQGNELDRFAIEKSATIPASSIKSHCQ